MAMALGLSAARHLEPAGRGGDLPPAQRVVRSNESSPVA
jgi:hypothetical protein